MCTADCAVATSFLLCSRKAKASSDVVMESKGRQRPEVGIKIHVPDYKRTSQTNND